MKRTMLEEFQLDLRSLTMLAEGVANMRLREPVYKSVMIAADLVLALRPFDDLIQKAIDAMLRDSDQLELDAAVLSQSLEDTRGIPASHRCHTVTGE